MLKLGSTSDYSADIASALATEGGHLSIGRGGFILLPQWRNAVGI